MKFQHGKRRKAIEYEKDLIKRWKQNNTFQKSIDNRPSDNSYVFYDGPPFITGAPHAGTLISSIVKDAVPRYWTMKGKRVERTWGWDCHGLPAEVYTEKKLGIAGKDQVLEYGLEKYICAARENMVQTGSEWEDTVDRVGRWVDFHGAYKTMDNDYMESVWWAFKELYNRGKIYEGEKVLMYCVQDATPLSKAEVTMDKGAYQDVTDPSVYVRFELKRECVGQETKELNLPVYMLAWTTTPWTLLSNTALAVNAKKQYVEVRIGDEIYIVAKDMAEKVLVDEKSHPLEYEILAEMPGEKLVGKEYTPLFVDRGDNAHKVWHADYVSTDSDAEGTGIVHLAPVYGEEDYALALEHKFPAVHTIDETGHFTEGPWKGEFVWGINKQIAKDMVRFTTSTLLGDYAIMNKDERIAFHEANQPEQAAAVWKIEYVKHSYPHCHRCGTKLMYRAHPSWFMDIIGQKTNMLAQNQDITWFPSHLKHGRFQKTVESAPDWNLSRDRFWATPMPIWEGEDENGNTKRVVVGSYDELYQLSGTRLEDYHRPWVDDVTFEKDGITYKRVDKVMDCWFESGSMPFAQFHYPFENKQKFEDNFPGDFIVEYVGQVRAWFYYLHAVNVGLFGQKAFKNVVVTGNVMGNDGYKLSKSRQNYTDPNEAMDRYSADAYRFVMLSSNLLTGEDYALLDKNISDVQRKLSMLWNVYDFFTLYAEVDKWEAPDDLQDPYSEVIHPLDKWVISRLHSVTAEVDTQMQAYNIPAATKPLLELLDDVSNWYVRRSRKRFWKNDNVKDKELAYRTLYYALVRVSMILAPFTPFMAEELYVLLTGKESVHLEDWPEVGHVDELLLNNMQSVRYTITEGLSLRAKAGIKVRQPLESVQAAGIAPEFELIVKEELNVKQVLSADEIAIDTVITNELKLEGLAREFVRVIQQGRKAGGLDVDDRIAISLVVSSEQLKQMLQEHKDYIMQETLAKSIESIDSFDDTFTSSKLGGDDIAYRLYKQG